MRQSALPPAFDHRTHASYAVQVRGTTYLWGSAGVTVNISFDQPLLLHVRNNVFGEVISLGTVASGTQVILGNIQPGECLTIPIQDMTGVFAMCTLETTVDCLIQASA